VALQLGATHAINPKEVNAAEAVLEITKGEGARIILEATGLPSVVWQDIERNYLGRSDYQFHRGHRCPADDRIPMNGEVFQVRRANVVGGAGPLRSWDFSAGDQQHGPWHGHDSHDH